MVSGSGVVWAGGARWLYFSAVCVKTISAQIELIICATGWTRHSWRWRALPEGAGLLLRVFTRHRAVRIRVDVTQLIHDFDSIGAGAVAEGHILDRRHGMSL